MVEVDEVVVLILDEAEHLYSEIIDEADMMHFLVHLEREGDELVEYELIEYIGYDELDECE